MPSRTQDVVEILQNRFVVERDKIAGALDTLRSSPEYMVAGPAQRANAERTYTTGLASLTASFLGEVRGHVQRCERVWREQLPSVVQRKAAAAHPDRARAVAELGRLASPHERAKLAQLLVEEGDSAGAYGLRQVLGAMDAPETNAGTIETLLQAGTAASRDALRELLGAQRGLAHALAAAHLGADGNDPLQVLKAANAATMVPLEERRYARVHECRSGGDPRARRMTTTCGDGGGTTKAGTPCRCALNLSPTSGLCMQHDPDRQAERDAMRAAGGKASGPAKRRAKAADPAVVPDAPKSLADAVRLASWIVRATLAGEIDVRVSEAATKAVRQFQLGEEKRVLEAEVRKLRAELAEARRETSRGVIGAISRG